MSFLERYPRGKGFDIKDVVASNIQSLDEVTYVLGELDSVLRDIEGQITRYHVRVESTPTERNDFWYNRASRALRVAESARRAVLARKKQLTPASVKGNPLAFEMFYLAARDVLGTDYRDLLDSIFGVMGPGTEAALDGAAGRAG